MKLNNPISSLNIQSIYTLIIIIIALLFISCNPVNNNVHFNDGDASIKGRILEYNGKFKSGLFSYFDSRGRIVSENVFTIDSLGRFEVSFNVPHPIYKIAHIEIEGKYHSIFLEPEVDLEITVINDELKFIGENGKANSQLISLEDTLNEVFKEEIEYARFLHMENISYDDYIQTQVDLSEKKLDFIIKYAKDNELCPAVYNAITKQTYYTPAWSWICFRNDNSQAYGTKRDSLPENFLDELYKTYPINDINAIVARNYIDYISNIGSVLAKEDDREGIINYIRASGEFTPEEMVLVEGVFKGDSVIRASEEYKLLNTTEHRLLINELIYKNFATNLLNSAEQIPRGIGRDLIISNQITNYYFRRANIEPTVDELEKMKNLIQSESIYNYLLDLDNSVKLSQNSNTKNSKIPPEVIESASKVSYEIFEKYVGNVVYVDFWATWCGPCKTEIPYSRTLIEQYKDEDVKFVFLCCKSRKNDWENAIKNGNIDGEHYFVEDEDFIGLSALFGVKAFPTYVLINKEGEIVMKDAPRPSSRIAIMAEIDRLLQ